MATLTPMLDVEKRRELQGIVGAVAIFFGMAVLLVIFVRYLFGAGFPLVMGAFVLIFFGYGVWVIITDHPIFLGLRRLLGVLLVVGLLGLPWDPARFAATPWVNSSIEALRRIVGVTLGVWLILGKGRKGNEVDPVASDQGLGAVDRPDLPG